MSSVSASWEEIAQVHRSFSASRERSLEEFSFVLLIDELLVLFTLYTMINFLY